MQPRINSYLRAASVTGTFVAMALISACGSQNGSTNTGSDGSDVTGGQVQNDGQQPNNTTGNAPSSTTATPAPTLRASQSTCSISGREQLAFEVTGLPDSAVEVEVEYKLLNGPWQPSQVNYSHQLKSPNPRWACFADNNADNPDPKGFYRMRLASKASGAETNWVEWETVS
jgi:hypothetical protein